MPEEINRILTDALADYLFVTEEDAIAHLLKEGRPRESIFMVGNADDSIHCATFAHCPSNPELQTETSVEQMARAGIRYWRTIPSSAFQLFDSTEKLSQLPGSDRTRSLPRLH